MTILHAIRTTAMFRAESVCATFRVATFCAAAFTVSFAPNAFSQSPLLSGAGSGLSGASTVQNGLFLQGKDTYRVVDTAGFRTAADVDQTQPGTIAQVAFGQACTSCGTSTCGGNCGGSVGGCGPCGTGSCGSGGYGGYNSGISDPCLPCDPYCYVSVEGLYMDNDTIGNFSLSPDFGLRDFEYEFGSRITIGSVADCVRGYEVSFTGPLEWNRSARRTSPPSGPIRTDLRPGAGMDLLDLSSFADFSEFLPVVADSDPEIVYNSVEQSQIYRAEYWSFEANKTLVSGEFAKLLFGTRYINYDELYVYNSRSTGIADRAVRPFVPASPIGAPAIPFREAIPGRPAGSGQLLSQTSNDLFGLQIGLDLLYPVCCHGYTDFRVRAGAYINSAQNQFRLINEDAFLQGATDSDTNLAGVFEIGSGFRYQVGEILSIRAGTELWYLTEIATASSQFGSTITSNSGSRTRSSDDVLMTGFSVGAQLRY